MGVLCCIIFNPLCKLSDYTVVGTALDPTLTVGMQQLALVSLRLYFHQATSVDPLKLDPRIAIIMDLDQLWAR